MIKVLGAFDKFKDSLSADEVGKVCLGTLEKIYPGKVQTKLIAMSDGGEGFLNALKIPLNLTIHKKTVTGPLGTPTQAEYGTNTNSGIAVIEMASASGLEKVPKGSVKKEKMIEIEKRNPLNTTTRGTGELIKAAYDAGFRKILLGVGGSATNDAGMGALQVLGVQIRLKDNTSPDIFYGKHLSLIESIDFPNEILPGAILEISCDVTSPFVGPKGAVYTFSGQKGASEEDKKILESGMIKTASILKNKNGNDISQVPGTGAAGGITGGFLGVFGQRVILKKGFDFIAEAHGLKEAIQQADLVLTGEGSYDYTSTAGKVPFQVMNYAKSFNKPVVIICGRKEIKDSHPQVPIYDLLSMFPVEVSMTQTKSCLEQLITKNSMKFPVFETFTSRL